MKKEFKEYLNEINLSESLIEHIEKQYECLSSLTAVTEFDDIFISEYSDKEGIRQYFSLWTFTEFALHKIAIGPNSKGDKIVITNLKDRVSEFGISDYNFDLINEDESSKLVIAFSLNANITGRYGLTATSRNCKKLLSIVKKYFIPNIK